MFDIQDFRVGTGPHRRTTTAIHSPKIYIAQIWLIEVYMFSAYYSSYEQKQYAQYMGIYSQ